MARAWQASVYLVSVPYTEDRDRIVRVPDFMLIVDRAEQYRLIWDDSVNAWRIDKRSADRPKV